MSVFSQDTNFYINKYFSYRIISENKLVCIVYGETKVLYCEVKTFEEFLEYVREKLLYVDILNKFENRYNEIEVNDFISVLLKEEIIKVIKDILGKTKEKTIIPKDDFEMVSTFNVIKRIVELIKSKTGSDVYFVDLSIEKLQTKVVRVIVIGNFQTMNIPLISVCDRLLDFGKNLAYSDKKISYEELFMGRYQH